MAWLLLMLLAVIWGSSFLSVKLAIGGFGPLTLAAVRTSGGAAILVLIVFLTGRAFPSHRKAWLASLGFAVFSNAVPFFMLNWAQASVPSAFAGVSMATVPLFILPMAALFVPGEALSWRRTIGLFLGFLGVLLLVGPGAAFNEAGGLLPRIACVGAALCYATGGIITRLAVIDDQIGFSAAGLAIAAAISWPVALVLEGPPSLPGAVPAVSAIYLAVFPTAIAALLLVRTIRAAGPVFLALVNYLVPLWAVVFGVLLLGEMLPGSFLAALLIILLAVALSQWETLQDLARALRRR